MCYERGGLNNGGHVHILIEGHLSAEVEDATKISLYWRCVLRLARKRVNGHGAKHTYKVHSKVRAFPLLPDTAVFFRSTPDPRIVRADVRLPEQGRRHL